jgi:hypothetical protein
VTEKPLDCIGLPSTAQVGKHDFRRHDNSEKIKNIPAVIPSAVLPNDKEVVDHVAIGRNLKLRSFLGSRIGKDKTLPPDVCEFRNKDGRCWRV